MCPYNHIFLKIMRVKYLVPVRLGLLFQLHSFVVVIVVVVFLLFWVCVFVCLFFEELETKDDVCGLLFWFSLTLLEILVAKVREGGLEEINQLLH